MLYRRLSLATLVLVLFSLSTATAEEIWELRSGKTSFFFNENLMEGLGLDLRVTQARPLAPVDPYMEHPNWSFSIVGTSNLKVGINYGSPSGLADGALHHDGDLVLVDVESGIEARLEGARIERLAPEVYTPDREVDDGLYMRSTDGDVALELVDCMLHVVPGDKLDIYYMNLTISQTWATKLGRPELGGLAIGLAQLQAELGTRSGTSDGLARTPKFGPGVDVKLGILDRLQQWGRLGSRVSLTMATTSCNVGDVDVPWLAPMDEDHPLIHMALYREEGGRFEQIGLSWMKHGFFALSSSQCTACQNQSNGTFLGVGCSDTYGPGNNSDRRYLGPRSEVNPYLGTWECSDSHFQGGSGDCVRGHGGSGHDALQHRLVLEDGELGLSGAQYYYEGYYVVANDVKRHNNWGWVPVTMALDGDTWMFTDAGPLTEGPAIELWGEQHTEFPIPADGKVILAVQTSDLGGGAYHYQYALLNFDSDREIRSFTLPVSGVNVTNTLFRDHDEDPTNNWTVLNLGGVLSWSTETHDLDPNAHALTFGEMFSFGFDADAAPGSIATELGLFLPPLGEFVTGSTLGPVAAPTAPSNPTVTSSSHTPDTWSNLPVINVTWSGASDPEGIGGYSLEWDQMPTTLPDETVDTTDEFASSPALLDGVDHWLHVRTVDGVGTWAPDASHLGPFWIDATTPVDPVTITSNPAVSTWVADDTILVGWADYSDNLSGVDAFSFLFDQVSDTAPDLIPDVAPGDSTVTSGAPNGDTWFHLRTKDVAGNWTDGLHVGPFQLDTASPAGAWVTPSGGEEWMCNAQQTIDWNESDATSGVQSVELRLSIDDGATFPTVIANPAPGAGSFAWTLPDLDTALPWRIQLGLVDGAGNATTAVSEAFTVQCPTSVALEPTPSSPAVTEFRLEPNAPNPFNPSTEIRYAVPEPSLVNLSIWTARGRLVRTLVNERQAPGWYTATWYGRDGSGSPLPSGIYYCRMKTPGFSKTQQLVLIK